MDKLHSNFQRHWSMDDKVILMSCYFVCGLYMENDLIKISIPVVHLSMFLP